LFIYWNWKISNFFQHRELKLTDVSKIILTWAWSPREESPTSKHDIKTMDSSAVLVESKVIFVQSCRLQFWGLNPTTHALHYLLGGKYYLFLQDWRKEQGDRFVFYSKLEYFQARVYIYIYIYIYNETRKIYFFIEYGK